MLMLTIQSPAEMKLARARACAPPSARTRVVNALASPKVVPIAPSAPMRTRSLRRWDRMQIAVGGDTDQDQRQEHEVQVHPLLFDLAENEEDEGGIDEVSVRFMPTTLAVSHADSVSPRVEPRLTFQLTPAGAMRSRERGRTRC